MKFLNNMDLVLNLLSRAQVETPVNGLDPVNKDYVDALGTGGGGENNNVLITFGLSGDRPYDPPLKDPANGELHIHIDVGASSGDPYRNCRIFMGIDPTGDHFRDGWVEFDYIFW